MVLMMKDGDVKVDGKWNSKPNLTPRGVKTQDWPRTEVARPCEEARVPRANLLSRESQKLAFARFERS